ncbi:MAG: OsmC family protein [Anaerolineales bacterium]|nr:OsmC family protein [Anaerolineales bacterium]
MSITARSKDGLQVEIYAGKHGLIADEPLDAGGENAGPSPYDFLLSSLAACTIMTLHLYARRKGWSLDSVEVKLDTDKVYAKDCEDCESDPNAKVDIIERELKILGDLEEDQLARLVQIADRCPVHRTLTSETKIRTTIV